MTPIKQKQKTFDHLLTHVQKLLAAQRPAADILQQVCNLLHATFDEYNWVGFYMVEPGGQTLRLGPFVGEPTEHVVIPVGRGICGQAAASGKTFLVDDVAKEANYLSCSIHVKSEIVVPIFENHKVVAELDIDSHTPSAFTPEDREFLEKLCGMLGELFHLGKFAK